MVAKKLHRGAIGKVYVLNAIWMMLEMMLEYATAQYTIFKNIYILGVFTEKPYSKPLACNVVYIPINTSHATLVTSKYVNVFLLQF